MRQGLTIRPFWRAYATKIALGPYVTRHGTLVLVLGLLPLNIVFVYASQYRVLNNFGCQVLSISILGFTKIIMFGYQLGLCLNM